MKISEALQKIKNAQETLSKAEEKTIQIRNVQDNLDRIDFKHVSRCYHCGHTTTQEVTIFRPNYNYYEGGKSQWYVIFSGAVDFEGNKKDMLKRYPEFKNITGDLK